MAREYTTEGLRAKLAGGERFYLIDTLRRDSYLKQHLPGALSLPLERIELEAAGVLPDLDVEVIAYCASPS